MVHACSVVSDSLKPHELQLTRLLYPWDFPGKNDGVGCHFLLQGISLTPGSNLHLLHVQVDYLPLYLLGSPQIRELMKTDSWALPSGDADVLDVATLEQHCLEHGPYPGILRHGSL